MQRLICLSLCTAAALGLWTCAAFMPSGQSFGEDAPRKDAAKKAEDPPKDAPAQKVDAPGDINFIQMEQQYAGMFRQLHKSELHFMRLACQPTKAQYDKIAAEGEPALKDIIKKFVQSQIRGEGNPSFDPRKTMIESITKSAKATLTPDQVVRYQKELDERTAARKKAVLLGLVAQVDKALVLTAEQRTKLGEILEKKWNDSWNQPQMFMSGGQYFPTMPDAEILPILTQTQKTTWSGIPKGNVHFGFNFGFMQWGGIDEVQVEVDAGVQVIPAPPADEEKKDPKPAEKK